MQKSALRLILRLCKSNISFWVHFKNEFIKTLIPRTEEIRQGLWRNRVSFMWNRHDQIIRKIIVGDDWVIKLLFEHCKVGLPCLYTHCCTGRRLYPSISSRAEFLQCENCVIQTLRNSWGCGGFLFVLWYIIWLWPTFFVAQC